MNVQEAIEKRYSTRYYEKNVKIEQEKIELIVNAGYLAPNGLGAEPWKFVIVENNLDKLSIAVNHQAHVTDASFIVALLHLKQDYVNKHPEILFDKWDLSGIDKARQEMYFELLKVKGDQYYREQLMFAAANMTIQASALDIGSVVVGGFDAQKTAEILNVDTEKYQLGLIVDFGISSDQEMKTRVRRNKDEVIEYKNI